MNTQLEQNTKITQYFLKNDVNDNDVADYMSEIKRFDLETKLRSKHELTDKETGEIMELLKGIYNLFRTYGKKSLGLETYMRHLKEKLKQS